MHDLTSFLFLFTLLPSLHFLLFYFPLLPYSVFISFRYWYSLFIYFEVAFWNAPSNSYSILFLFHSISFFHFDFSPLLIFPFPLRPFFPAHISRLLPFQQYFPPYINPPLSPPFPFQLLSHSPLLLPTYSSFLVCYPAMPIISPLCIPFLSTFYSSAPFVPFSLSFSTN